MRIGTAAAWLAASLVGIANAREPDVMELFDPSRPGALQTVSIVNDVVMGGHSTSRVALDGDALVFEGTVRLDDGGGFASMRIDLPEAADLTGFGGIELVVRGDGRRYKLHLRDDVGPESVRHQVAFATDAGERLTLRLPFPDFEPRTRGRPVPDAAPLEQSRIRQLGSLVSDAQAGEFRLEVLAVRAYR